MPIFQYQARTSSGPTTDPETVTVDRWTPTYPQPSRALPRFAAVVAGLTAFVEPIAPEAVQADRATPTFRQPDRTPRYAQGTTWTGPVSTLAESVTFDRWAPIYPQPNRTPRYAAGTTYAAPVSTLAESTTVDRWIPTFRQPDRTPRYAPGSVVVVLTTSAESTTADRWAPTFVQPSRTPRYARGTDWAGVLTTAAESVTVDRWLNAQPQPSRAIRYARGPDIARPVLDFVASTQRDYASTIAGNWSSAATWATQPGNADFETPVNGTANSFVDFNPATPWVRTTPVWTIRPPSSLGAPNPAQSGLQCIGIQNGGKIEQTFLWTGGTYGIDIYAARRAAQAQILSIRIDDVEKGTIQPLTNAWVLFSVSLGTITVGSHKLSIVGTVTGGDNMAFIDALTITGGPGGTPGIGDTAIVGHAVTVDSSVTVGTSPSDTTTAVLTVTNPGSLTVADGVTFGVRGNWNQTGTSADVTIGASVVEFSAAAAGTPATKYKWTIATGSEAGGTAPKVTINGTIGSHAVIRSNAGGGNAGITGSGVNDSGRVFATYCDFLRMGSSSTDALSATTASAAAGPALDHCTFTSCGPMREALNGNPTSLITNCTWSGSLGTTCYTTTIAATTAGKRTLSGNVFDKATSIRFDHVVADDNIFLGFPDDPSAGSSSPKATSFARNFLRITGLSSGRRRADWTECYVINDGSTYDGFGQYSATAIQNNPHYTTPIGSNGTYAVTSCIIEGWRTTGDGDIDYGPATGRNSAFSYCIVLPDQIEDVGLGPRNSGTLATHDGWSGGASTYDHCTFYGGGQGLLALAEGGNGFANMITSARSNLCWNNAARLNGGFNYFAYLPTSPAGAVLDMITPANLDYNGGWNIKSTLPVGFAAAYPASVNTNGHYAIPLSATVGAHDVYGDPQFVDPTRSFSSWVASLEASWAAAPSGAFPSNAAPSGTDFNAHGLYKLSLVNQPSHADYDSRYTLAALKTYIRTGFAPTNSAFATAAHDGTTIGAVAFQEQTSADKWAPTFVQPGRAVKRAAGAVAFTTPEVTTADKWAPVIVQPGRSVRRASGVVAFLAPETPTADQWLPLIVQPGRSIRYAAGASVLPVLDTTPPAPPVDWWTPTTTQPSRTPRLAPGVVLAMAEPIETPIETGVLTTRTYAHPAAGQRGYSL